MSLHFHPLRLRAKHQDTDDAVVLCFDVPEALRDTFRFTQGQYLTLRGDVDGQDLRRSYSICAGVDDGELRVGVRQVDGGAFSTWVHRQLKAGDEIQVFPPQGRFHVPLDPSTGRHYVGIAAGSGITPILSIMKTVLAREPMSRFTLIYGNRRPASTMFKEELEDLKNRYMTRLTLHHVFSREHVDAPLMAGRLDRAKLGDFLAGPVPAAGIDQVFVCGPFEVNEQAEAARRHDHYSDFGNATTAKLSSRLTLVEGVALRGAVSTNFRAPSLAQRGFSFTVTDRGDGGELSQIRTLPVDSPIARYLGAQDLKAERSRNASLGLTWQPDRHWSATLDAYAIRVKDRVTLSQRISGDGLSDTLESLFGVPGIDGVNFFTNALDTRTP